MGGASRESAALADVLFFSVARGQTGGAPSERLGGAAQRLTLERGRHGTWDAVGNTGAWGAFCWMASGVAVLGVAAPPFQLVFREHRFH